MHKIFSPRPSRVSEVLKILQLCDCHDNKNSTLILFVVNTSGIWSQTTSRNSSLHGWLLRVPILGEFFYAIPRFYLKFQFQLFFLGYKLNMAFREPWSDTMFPTNGADLHPMCISLAVCYSWDLLHQKQRRQKHSPELSQSIKTRSYSRFDNPHHHWPRICHQLRGKGRSFCCPLLHACHQNCIFRKLTQLHQVRLTQTFNLFFSPPDSCSCSSTFQSSPWNKNVRLVVSLLVLLNFIERSSSENRSTISKRESWHWIWKSFCSLQLRQFHDFLCHECLNPAAQLLRRCWTIRNEISNTR